MFSFFRKTPPAPAIQIPNQQPNKYYTLIMFDHDAPSSPYLHWLVVNIHQTDSADQTIVFPYAPPSPPVGNAPHRYETRIYEQTGKIGAFRTPIRQPGFDLEGFVRETGLRQISTSTQRISATIGGNRKTRKRIRTRRHKQRKYRLSQRK